MADQGYAAVTSRSVATQAGLQAGNIHYYFPTLDDLFVAIMARGGERNMERIAAALASPRPLTALWRMSSDKRGATLLVELTAATNHRKALRDEVAALAETARRMQSEGLRQLLPQYAIDDHRFPPGLVAATIQGLALLVAREQVLGLATESLTTNAAVESLLDELEERRARSLAAAHRDRQVRAASSHEA
jgi:AcrR family transcriptional regulator